MILKVKKVFDRKKTQVVVIKGSIQFNNISKSNIAKVTVLKLY